MGGWKRAWVNYCMGEFCLGESVLGEKSFGWISLGWILVWWVYLCWMLSCWIVFGWIQGEPEFRVSYFWSTKKSCDKRKTKRKVHKPEKSVHKNTVILVFFSKILRHFKIKYVSQETFCFRKRIKPFYFTKTWFLSFQKISKKKLIENQKISKIFDFWKPQTTSTVFFKQF